jgi:hypothetical protein
VKLQVFVYDPLFKGDHVQPAVVPPLRLHGAAFKFDPPSFPSFLFPIPGGSARLDEGLPQHQPTHKERSEAVPALVDKPQGPAQKKRSRRANQEIQGRPQTQLKVQLPQLRVQVRPLVLLVVEREMGQPSQVIAIHVFAPFAGIDNEGYLNSAAGFLNIRDDF